MVATLTLTLLAPATVAHADWNHPLPRDWYVSLARCETANNTKHSTASYVSAFGIYRRTWDLYADTPNRRATTLDFAAQARVVDRIAFFGHTEKGRKQWPVGPWGFGSIRHNCNDLQQAICDSTNPHVRPWRRNCTTPTGGN